MPGDNLQKQSIYLKPEDILSFFLETDDNVDTLVKCKATEVELLTTDQDLYEALGSLQQPDKFELNKLVKFFESVDVISYKRTTRKEKPILTHERVEQLRRVALQRRPGQ